MAHAIVSAMGCQATGSTAGGRRLFHLLAVGLSAGLTEKEIAHA